MAQRRDKRNQRSKRPAPIVTGPSPAMVQRRRRLRAVVVLLAIVIGLAGIFVVTTPDDPSGRPAEMVPIT